MQPHHPGAAAIVRASVAFTHTSLYRTLQTTQGQKAGLICRRLLVRLRPSGRLTRLQGSHLGCAESITVAETSGRKNAMPSLPKGSSKHVRFCLLNAWLLGLQAFLLVTIYLALQVDVFVARSQRRQLGLCEDCGGVNDPASCPQPGCPMRVAGDQS